MTPASLLSRVRMTHASSRLMLPLACAASAIGLAVAGGWGLVAALLVASAWIVPTAVARRRAAAGVVDDLERISSVVLAPGASVHTIRFRESFLLVGVSQTSVSLLDRVDAAASSPTPRSRGGTVAGLVVAMAILAAPTLGAQSESAAQRADLEPHSTAPSLAPPAVPPAPLDLQQVDVAPVSTGPIVWLAALSLLPFGVMAMTSFVKTTVVLSLLRSGLGTPQVPSDPVLAGIALSLTAFVMAPVAGESARRIRESGADPSTVAGAMAAVAVGVEPFRAFLVRNTRTDEIALFVDISTRNGAQPARPDALEVLVPAFVTSELRRAFIAGFFILVPFLVVDLVVSNILMSMGMVMVSPATVSLPFKIMLFVLIDGWPLLMKGLALGYH